jgi:rare lipoprotein A
LALALAAPGHATDGDADAKLVQRNTPESRAAEKAKHHEPDLSAKKRVGKASFYAEQFFGKKMADGSVMDPHGDNAASKTLPLGTTAKVTNVDTGKSAIVTIRDRGPYVPGRIVDLSPSTARKIGISRRQGVAKVVVAPIVVPLPNGGVKLGAAAGENLVRLASLDIHHSPNIEADQVAACSESLDHRSEGHQRCPGTVWVAGTFE